MATRRGVLGFLGGAAVAGPRVARQVAAETLQDLSVETFTSAVPPLPPGVSQATTAAAPSPARELLKLAARTPEMHAYFRRRTGVYALDPDLASYRSFSLGAKIALQRERNYRAELDAQTGWLNARIAGWFDD